MKRIVFGLLLLTGMASIASEQPASEQCKKAYRWSQRWYELESLRDIYEGASCAHKDLRTISGLSCLSVQMFIDGKMNAWCKKAERYNHFEKNDETNYIKSQLVKDVEKTFKKNCNASDNTAIKTGLFSDETCANMKAAIEKMKQLDRDIAS